MNEITAVPAVLLDDTSLDYRDRHEGEKRNVTKGNAKNERLQTRPKQVGNTSFFQTFCLFTILYFRKNFAILGIADNLGCVVNFCRFAKSK